MILDGFRVGLGQSRMGVEFVCFWNACLDSQTRILCFALKPVGDLPISLPDLRSRVGQLPHFALRPLSEADIAQALSRRAQVANLRLPPEVIEYLLRHHARSISQLSAMLSQIEQGALRLQRPVTIPLVKQILGARNYLASNKDYCINIQIPTRNEHRPVSLVTRNEHRKTP